MKCEYPGCQEEAIGIFSVVVVEDQAVVIGRAVPGRLKFAACDKHKEMDL